MLKVYLQIAYLIVLIILFSIMAFGQTNYYLSNTTKGTGDGLSWTNAKAWGNFSTNTPDPGDTVFFDGGTDSLVYTSSTYSHATIAFFITSDGVDGNPIVYTRGKDAGHDGIPIFNVPDKYEFYLYGANYVEVSFLKIYCGGIGEAERYGLIVSGETVSGQVGCRYIDILSNEFDYTYGSGLQFTYSNVTIDNNYIHTAAVSISDPDLQDDYDEQNDGIKSNYGFNTTISNNRIINRTSKHDYQAEAHRDLMQLDKMNYSYGTWLKINNNFLMTDYQEPDSAGTQGIYISTSVGRVDIYNNIIPFYNNHEDPISISTSAVEPYATTNMVCNIYNNTIIQDSYTDNYSGQTITFGGSYPTPLTINFKNNLVVNPHTTGSIIAFYSNFPDNFDFDYNQYKIGLTTGFGSSSIGNWATWTGTYGQDAHSEKATDLFSFVNEGTQTPTDYALTEGSSGIAEGINIYTLSGENSYHLFNDDYLGAARSTIWDVGAIAYSAALLAPDPPVIQAATSVKDDSLTANWTAAATATGYYLDVATDRLFESMLVGYSNLNVGDVTSKVVTGLTPETEYFIRVRAYNSYGTSSNSGTDSATTTTADVDPIPGAPTIQSATIIDTASFRANWIASTYATGYYLDIATDLTFTSYVSGYQNLDVGDVVYKDVTGLTAETEYFIRVRAYNSNGTSSNSAIDSATTTALYVPPSGAGGINLIYTLGLNDFTDASNWYSTYAGAVRTDTSTFTTLAGWAGYGLMSITPDLFEEGVEYTIIITLDAGSPAIDLDAVSYPSIAPGELIGHILPGYNEFTYTAGATYKDILFRDINGGAATYKFTEFKVYDGTILPIEINYPVGGEVFVGSDTINILFENSVFTTHDSLKIYYSTNAGTSWNFISKVDTSQNSYSWIVPEISTTQARIRITSDDSLQITSNVNSFSIYPSSRAIYIIDPTETTRTIIGDIMTITCETFNMDYFKAYYSFGDSNYILINDSIVVDPGDGNLPDTTSFTWDISSISLFNPITIRCGFNDNVAFTGSSTEPYYGTGEYVFADYRSHYPYGQSVNMWSDMYLIDDELYTVSFFGFVWGWYDYNDVVEVWKWNIGTDKFELFESKATPGAAFYPQISCFRSADNIFTMWNNYTGVSGFYKSIHKTVTLSYPGISDWSNNIEGVVPINIDGGNYLVNYDGWQYTLDQAARTITATDLNNPENQILVTDASAGGYVAEGNVDFYVYDNHILISRRYWQGEFGNAAVWIVGNSFPQNEPGLYDEVTFVLQGVTRNYFRGVYPNALIEYFPPIR